MIKKSLLFTALLIVLNSCVSSKLYEDLQSKNEALQAENELLSAQLDEWNLGNKDKYTQLAEKFTKEIEALKYENAALASQLATQKENYNRLQKSYDALEKNSDASLSENLQRNRVLLEQLEAKEKVLAEEAERLRQLELALSKRTQRVEELEAIIAAKDRQMNQLKSAISAALSQFEGNGLTVEQRDGKVYVSMENKLLFESGSWAVNSRGRSAILSLGNVLAENPEIAVLIEGHTDTIPYSGNGNITNNWDLSTKRATAIVEILAQNSGIQKNNLTAAGRGEFAPVASNNNAADRAKNRRIEVILAPKLDALSKLLEEL